MSKNSRFRVRPIDIMIVLLLGGLIGWKGYTRAPKPSAEPSSFARQIDLDALGTTAVQADGRLRSFESHAKTYMRYISGPRQINGQSNGFTYLDLAFRPERYANVDMVYVKNKQVRSQILDALEDHPDMNPGRRAAIFKSGLISRSLLTQPEVLALLRELRKDLIRTAKQVDAIDSALAVADPDFLLQQLRFVAPPSGKVDEPWLSIVDVLGGSVPQDDAHAGMPSDAIAGLDPNLQTQITKAWLTLRDAWRAENAEGVNTQITKLAGLFPKVSSQLYPSTGRLGMESWYFRNKSMTWVWLFYLASVLPLLMSVVYRWDGARKVGMLLFVVAFLAHTTSVGIRWYISGRWPNSNMFEAVTTAAWFGGVAALVLEWVSRRTAFRNLFALGSAVVSMAALMAAYFLPTGLDSSISNKMAALNDVWLYIHTNMIIWSYAVIGLACIPALLYLRNRWCMLWDSGFIPKARLLVLPIALIVLNYTGYRLLMHMINNAAQGLSMVHLIGVTMAFAASLMVTLLELFAGGARRAAGMKLERSAVGGAASLIMGSSAGQGFLKQDRPSAGQVFDGATMVLVEVSFVMLWTGVVMGAIWADHSWGRPWGWDPKEVFALNTFIIFLVLLHVRLKVRDKGFWTAVLAIVGFEVMMFNWIVVNFVITGLHSYA